MAFTWDETYTLPENFFLAYQRSGDERYRELGKRFIYHEYYDALAANQNALPGKHAYSHVNTFSSAMQAYLVLGDEQYLRAATNGLRMVQEQSYATGGWGPNEAFVEPGKGLLGASLGTTRSSFETPCGAYGQFKITRYLLRVTQDSRYGDSMEQVLYGHDCWSKTHSARRHELLLFRLQQRRRQKGLLQGQMALLLGNFPATDGRLWHQFLLSGERRSLRKSLSAFDWRPYCRALASVVSDDPDDASDPLDELDDAPPPFEQHLAAAIPLLRALASANHDGWQVAVDEALAAHARYHHQQPERLLSLAVTGLAALAFDRDDVATEGVPRALVRHEQPRPAGRAVYEYATRYADRVDDPHDFLLLEGYLGDQERDRGPRRRLVPGALRARAPRPAPRAHRLLLPLDGRSPRGDRLPALNLGERVMLAYYYGELPEQHAPHLAHAIELLDVVLRAIPEGSDALPEAALLTERGRAYHRQDPRRFHHDALRAHRQMLALRLSNKAAQPA